MQSSIQFLQELCHISWPKEYWQNFMTSWAPFSRWSEKQQWYGLTTAANLSLAIELWAVRIGSEIGNREAFFFRLSFSPDFFLCVCGGD